MPESHCTVQPQANQFPESTWKCWTPEKTVRLNEWAQRSSQNNNMTWNWTSQIKFCLVSSVDQIFVSWICLAVNTTNLNPKLQAKLWTLHLLLRILCCLCRGCSLLYESFSPIFVKTLYHVAQLKYLYSLCVFKINLCDFLILQRAPAHQIGDTTLPRSDPNLSAPDKGTHSLSLHIYLYSWVVLGTVHSAIRNTKKKNSQGISVILCL